MKNLLRKLRLYRIATISKILPNFLKKSRKISREYDLSFLRVFKDMVRSLMKFGSSDENYEQFHFWEHDDKFKDSFITWRRNSAIMYKFCTAASRELFLNKVTWNKRFAKYVKRDWLYCKAVDTEAIKNFLSLHEDVIVKRIDGSCGRGVEKCKANEILSNVSLLSTMGGANIILEEVAVNIDEIRQFSPSSLNTLRFVTCIDRNGKPHIIATALRMGNGKSHTDNIVTGGIACWVDTDTGVIATGGMNVEGKFFEKHPFSHIVFKGFKIPQWEEAKKLVLDLALEVPEARFVGWDVVLTEKGIDILEGNIPPGEELTELNMTGKYHQVMAMY